MLFALTLAAAVAPVPCAWSQPGATSAPEQVAAPSDQTLEIAPRIAPPPPPPAAEPTAPADGAAGDAAPPSEDADSPAHPAPPANTSRPFLGIAVQTIYSNDRPSGLVTGLEVVSVDPNSPAAAAGLHARTKMTSVGESGATVSSLMPPLNLFVMPLLKKTGSLGHGGDLIVAIDDRRVLNDYDLQSELESLKPGDVIYLTITRAMPDGTQKTLKLPIKLGDAAQAAATAGADEAIPTAPPNKHP